MPTRLAGRAGAPWGKLRISFARQTPGTHMSGKSVEMGGEGKRTGLSLCRHVLSCVCVLLARAARVARVALLFI